MAKPKRKVYHVTPNSAGGWNVQKEGSKRGKNRDIL